MTVCWTQVICNHFLGHIEKLDILKRDEIDKVFGNIRELSTIHSTLWQDLLEADRAKKDHLNSNQSCASASVENSVGV